MLKKDPNYFKAKKPELVADYQKEEADAIQVGSRCQSADALKRKGEVKYVGKVPGLGNGYWIGVHLDEPVGNCNGTSDGVGYFASPEAYGLFLRPKDLEVGDFPKDDDFDPEEDMI